MQCAGATSENERINERRQTDLLPTHSRKSTRHNKESRKIECRKRGRRKTRLGNSSLVAGSKQESRQAESRSIGGSVSAKENQTQREKQATQSEEPTLSTKTTSKPEMFTRLSCRYFEIDENQKAMGSHSRTRSLSQSLSLLASLSLAGHQATTTRHTSHVPATTST
ncbi:hypothetical protein BJX68DRAFT_18484 [Aspergillus pseudodeflectus]|uniref:Uncharacterized protein n=1 Tax=Aspergillus pseudodeflectus TaxID=176178 RepID=A0ABR4LFG3_9EURO